MSHDDLDELDEFVAYLLVDDDAARTDTGCGCAGCLGASMLIVAVLAVLGLASRWLMALIAGR